MTLGFKPKGSEFVDQKSTLPCRHSGGSGIQVTANVRHTVEKRYPGSGEGWTPVFTGVTTKTGCRPEFILSHVEGPA
jgi:hypothetical protein